jgi:RNA polymerase sigma factor (sigma-70 family)
MSTLPPIASLKALEEDAWSQLVNELFPKALAAARSKLHGEFEEDARDVAIQSLQVLQEKIHTVASSDQLPPLLIAITYGEAVDFLRRQHSQKRGGGMVFRYGVVEDWFESEGFPEASETTLPTDDAHFSSLGKIIQNLASVLSPKVRALLIDRYYHNKSSVEIAEAHGMKEGTVRVALSRALDELHEQLRGHAQLYQEVRSLLALPEKLLSLLFAFL